MKEQLITEITRKMLPYLDNSQMEQLQEVLTHCFWGVQVSPSSEEERLQEKETNKELLEMFISAKRVEGCSDQTCGGMQRKDIKVLQHYDFANVHCDQTARNAYEDG